MLTIKNRILKKIKRKLDESEASDSERELDLCSELTPDVIVIKDDQSLLFEAQNVRALEVLAQVCGFDTDTVTLAERIRVHPCRSPQIINQLKAVGATVSGF